MTPTPSPAPVIDSVVTSGSWAEWFTFAAAFAALMISIGAFVIAKRSERRLQFMRVHEIMTSVDAQSGRRLLREHAKSSRALTRLRKRHSDEFDTLNRAVSLYHTLAIYARRGYVPEEAALAHWGLPLRRSWTDVETFILWRDAEYKDADGWDDLLWFAELAGADVSEARSAEQRRQSALSALVSPAS